MDAELKGLWALQTDTNSVAPTEIKPATSQLTLSYSAFKEETQRDYINSKH